MGNYSEDMYKGKVACINWNMFRLEVLIGSINGAWGLDLWSLSSLRDLCESKQNFQLISLESDWICSYLASSPLSSPNLFFKLNVTGQKATWAAPMEKMKITTNLF